MRANILVSLKRNDHQEIGLTNYNLAIILLTQEWISSSIMNKIINLSTLICIHSLHVSHSLHNSLADELALMQMDEGQPND